jgi:hypothetical protein
MADTRKNTPITFIVPGQLQAAAQAGARHAAGLLAVQLATGCASRLPSGWAARAPRVNPSAWWRCRAKTSWCCTWPAAPRSPCTHKPHATCCSARRAQAFARSR